MTPADQLRDLLDVIAELAPRLRAAGIAGKVEAGGVAFDLLPAEAPESTQPSVSAEELAKQAEAADEAAAYGLPPGSKIPGFDRPPDLERKAST